MSKAAPTPPPLAATRRGAQMAERTAAQRAAHQLLDPPPRLFDDELALRIIGPERERWMREHIGFFDHPQMRPVRVYNAVRSRFAEEELALALARGVEQYVILGAGLDTFAYRHPLARELQIFEVDHPDTQSLKRQRLAEAGIVCPANVRLVSVDFNEKTLAQTLTCAGCDLQRAVFCAWMGVTYYLPRESVLATLAFIARLPAGSGIAFDFALAESALTPAQVQALRPMMEFVAREGEPWLSSFTPDEIRLELDRLGFRHVAMQTVSEAVSRFAARRPDVNLDLATQLVLALS